MNVCLYEVQAFFSDVFKKDLNCYSKQEYHVSYALKPLLVIITLA